ncbi:ChaB family protein [Isoptericola sp. b441]|uniref:ChaB family protein n=1 Tax=Actinotalea lenta TaxID=3064654 RepID=A0ABT9D7B0_9CELL|nr:MULTISPECIES: ChaB family protein [unclassified Isoptericola]MDO8106725.1 ChaB family protein [Isoptericola sp. b441]MDO8121563.1 ChaB family protein [Isoptericola sp. b490]
MPMTRGGKVLTDELPDTIARSDSKARRTFAEAHDSAADEYGEGRRAHQTAYAALKHTHEKVGDHWEPKDDSGPSDAHAARSRGNEAPTHGGVDANASKKHLYDVAKRLDVPGRSSMTKDELVEAIEQASSSSGS